jgi:hypothetical protein
MWNLQLLDFTVLQRVAPLDSHNPHFQHLAKAKNLKYHRYLAHNYNYFNLIDFSYYAICFE